MLFAHVKGVCDTPLQFLAEDFLFADYMNFLSSTASVEAKLLINVFICLFAYSKLPVQFDNVKIYIKNYQYDETMQFATSKTTGTTRCFNLQH